MIFVTVGTHEQPFERLLKTVDNLRAQGHIMEPVFMQTGHTAYQPMNCGFRQFLPFHVMLRVLSSARLIITHGGDFVMMVLRLGKTPIVVPRLKKYGEHVDDHQLFFVQHLSSRGLIAPCVETTDLLQVIAQWQRDQLPGNMKPGPPQSTASFAAELERLCSDLINFPGVLT